MAESRRGTALTVFAALFGLLAISNFLKPLQLTESAGFVFFGSRLSGTANAIAGPLFGLFLAVYAYGIWTMRRFALPMGHAYATYVILNLFLWTMRMPEGANELGVVGGIVYAAVAIGVSLGAAILLTKRKAELT
ncbi:MAG: hypothetical protein ACRERC_10305 [Candidatus Binatia bacterium]